MNNSTREERVFNIVCGCSYLSVCHRMGGSRLSLQGVRYWSLGISTRSCVILYITESLLSMRRRPRRLQLSDCSIAVTLEVLLYSLLTHLAARRWTFFLFAVFRCLCGGSIH